MREIEFQAWDTINQKMIKSPMAIVSGDGGWVLFTSEIENLNCYNAVHPIQQYKIRQFIGCKDRDGQKIYEGDIVSLETGPDSAFPSAGNYEVTLTRF